MKIVAKTDVGHVRESNQDSYAAGELPDGVAWAVVCDGMGGAAGGNIASTMAVKIISDQLTGAYRPAMSEKSIRNLLESAVSAANAGVHDMANSNAELAGMGTTVVVAVVREGAAFIAHAGDSRAYQLSKNGVTQLTKDHSIVQTMLEKGELTPDEAREHPRKNIITRALGVDETIDVDFCVADLEENDMILLCTDGLSNFLEADDIYDQTKDGKYYAFADRLVNLANANGGGDNITVVAIAK